MTIKELIEKLKAFPETYKVVVAGCDCNREATGEVTDYETIREEKAVLIQS